MSENDKPESIFDPRRAEEELEWPAPWKEPEPKSRPAVLVGGQGDGYRFDLFDDGFPAPAPVSIPAGPPTAAAWYEPTGEVIDGRVVYRFKELRPVNLDIPTDDDPIAWHEATAKRLCKGAVLGLGETPEYTALRDESARRWGLLSWEQKRAVFDNNCRFDLMPLGGRRSILQSDFDTW